MKFIIALLPDIVKVLLTYRRALSIPLYHPQRVSFLCEEVLSVKVILTAGFPMSTGLSFSCMNPHSPVQ